ncbi:MAG: hypothetical protein IK955_08810 [Clostridia bacterium]|nr:hypothetical protein [Clostridia bacterium]
MISTNLNSILNAREAAKKLMGQELPVKVSYRVAKLIKAMNSEIEVYDQERIRLCEKYGELDKKKGEYKISETTEFYKDLNSLLDIEVSLDVRKVSLPETLSITPADILSLSDFIEIEGVEDD